jgi:hypothetical protein
MRRGQEILIDLEGIESGTKSRLHRVGIQEKDAAAGNFFLRTLFLFTCGGRVCNFH